MDRTCSYTPSWCFNLMYYPFYFEHINIIPTKDVTFVHTRTRRTSSIQVSAVWIPGIEINQMAKPVWTIIGN
jgi:hypothetical protein